MPTAEKVTTPEAKAYHALLAHARSCKVCQANGRDLCAKYRTLFLRWDRLQRNQT